MRVVFMGTPPLAATILGHLARTHEIAAVYTRPDAVRGRGNKLEPSPVKCAAETLGIPVRTPSRLDAASVADLASLAPDVVCVSAYGVILPADVLGIPRFGCLNVHTSLLPRWRGAAPIERAILAGDKTTGVCIMKMEEGLDTGPYCRRAEMPVGNSTSAQLTERLANLGARELVRALDDVGAGTVVWTAQAQDGMTYAEKIRKGELNPIEDDTAASVVAKVRASSPPHPARAAVAGRTLAIEQAALVVDDQGRQLCAGLEPGNVRFAAKRLFAGAADAPFEVLRVKPDGKKSMDARSFAGGVQGIKNRELQWGRC